MGRNGEEKGVRTCVHVCAYASFKTSGMGTSGHGGCVVLDHFANEYVCCDARIQSVMTTACRAVPLQPRTLDSFLANFDACCMKPLLADTKCLTNHMCMHTGNNHVRYFEYKLTIQGLRWVD